MDSNRARRRTSTERTHRCKSSPDELHNLFLPKAYLQNGLQKTTVQVVPQAYQLSGTGTKPFRLDTRMAHHRRARSVHKLEVPESPKKAFWHGRDRNARGTLPIVAAGKTRRSEEGQPQSGSSEEF